MPDSIAYLIPDVCVLVMPDSTMRIDLAPRLLRVELLPPGHAVRLTKPSSRFRLALLGTENTRRVGKLPSVEIIAFADMFIGETGMNAVRCSGLAAKSPDRRRYRRITFT